MRDEAQQPQADVHASTPGLTYWHAHAPVGAHLRSIGAGCAARHMKGLTLMHLACPPNGGAKERAHLGAWWQVRRAHAHARMLARARTHAHTLAHSLGRAAAGFAARCACS